jgi:two-component system KDP operon response regulator KdpE
VSRILVVDDDVQICRALAINLRGSGYEVESATTGEEALRLAAASPPDLVLLDLGLPGLDGLEVIEGIRGWTPVPIVVLSARDADKSKVAALDAGADDYVTKPFSMSELLARVRVCLRRQQPAPELPVIVTPDFTIDLARHRITKGGELVHLTPIEWLIVELLVQHPGRLVTQREMLQRVWGRQFEEQTNYLRVHLTAIRKKLEPKAGQPRYFLTEPRIGYRFEGADPS